MSRHWLDGERLRLYPLAVIAIYLGWIAILIIRSKAGLDPSGQPLGFDFITFWGASRLALAGNAVAAYDPQLIVAAEKAALPGSSISAVGPWQYPPMFHLLIWPLGLMPYFLAYIVFIAISLAAYLLVIRRVLASQGLAGAGSWLPVLGFPGVFLNLLEGQNGFLTAALMGAALLLLQSRQVWAGFAIGLLTIKPHLGILLPLALICGGYWRAIICAVLTTVAFAVISVAALGFETLPAFLSRLPVVADWVAQGRLPLAKIVSVFSLARSAGLPTGAAYLLHGAVSLAVAAAVAWAWRTQSDFALRAAALVMGSVLISPYLFDYDLIWLSLALAWFVGDGVRNGWHRGERELLAAIWLLPMLVSLAYRCLGLQLAPLVLLLFFCAILRRIGGKREPAAGASRAGAASI